MERELTLAVRFIAEFMLRAGSIDSRFSGTDRAAQGGRIHRMLQKRAGKGYKAEVTLRHTQVHGGICYTLAGRADGVITAEDGSITVDEIKTTAQPLETLSEDSHPEHWGQGRIYAHMLCLTGGHTGAAVRLTYYNIDTDEIQRFTRHYTAEDLAAFYTGLLEGYQRWALLTLDWADKRNAGLQKLRFPFEEYREGQRGMAVAAYNTFEAGGRLFACAPTGIGKTVSALFPAMKAMGEGMADTIFYLTAKTITRKAAEDTLALLRETAGGLDFYSITLTAKDKICKLDERACNPDACPWADGYYDRVNDAVYEILQSGEVFSREVVERYADHYRLCPYELTLDLATWCDCVIGDYNYLFDPVVHLKRFFEGVGGEYLFLVDEAHNLVDRSRDMYSAGLRKRDFFSFKKELPKQYRALHTALKAVNDAFIALRKECEAEGEGFLRLAEAPEGLYKAVYKFTGAAQTFLDDNRGSEWEGELLALYFDALFYEKVHEWFDDTYKALVYTRSSEVRVKLFCLDPAHFLDESLSKGRAAVLFSATLQPLRYYRETLGGGGTAKLLGLESPFPRENLGLYIADGVSTKYTDREHSLDDVCHLIAAMAAAKRGNYIAYFPSYSYMRTAHLRFVELYPEVDTIEQETGMSEAAREDFLAAFGLGGDGLLGFCVLGGIFAEGVDLAGDRLVGTAIVGVGLPQLGPEPDALRNYYDEKNGCGFGFAYQYPGMNKVLQAAGRVIRGENDRGVVLLIDSRFTSYRYGELMPAHWQGYETTSLTALPAQLAAFWEMGASATE